VAINIDQSTQGADEGVWTKYRGSEFRVVHTGHPKFQRALSRLQAPHRRKIEKGTMDPVESRDLLCAAIAEALVLDWKGVVDSKGADIPYSRKICETALINNPDLREYIQEFSMDLENFRVEEQVEKGND
jgi:hypothetical protein